MTKPGSCSIWNIYPKKSNSDKLIFCVLIFITVNLVICTCYSIYREKYAINQDYLKSIRTILVAATLLQLLCFVGYWIGIYVMYQFCTITWDTLITSAVMLMVVRFGESYIVLVTENYTLQNHSEIPFKFTITIFLIWFIGSCINIIGYVFAFVSICRHPKNIHNIDNKISSSCFVAWTISCLLILSIGMYILTRIERRFKRILQDKLEYKDDRKQSRLKKHLLKQQNNQITQNKKMVPKLTLTSQTINENHADEQKYDTHSFNTYSKLPTHTTETTYSKKMNASALSTTIGSINDSIMTQRGIIMKSELKRMRILIYGLLFLICIFLFNGVYQVYQLLKSLDKISWLNKLSWLDDFSVEDPEHIKWWVVTYLIYTKWTIMNVFVMCFSWIPRSRMLDEWSN